MEVTSEWVREKGRQIGALFREYWNIQLPVKVSSFYFNWFIPGDHEIEVKYAGSDVQGSPFTCRAYDPAKIGVGDIPNSVVDKPVHFIGKILNHFFQERECGFCTETPGMFRSMKGRWAN